jgi:hypothetical protein
LHVIEDSRRAGSDDDPQIAVIGCGLRRTLALAADQPGRGSRVTIVCALDETARRRDAEAFGAAPVADYQEVLDRDIDAVIVNTLDHTHEHIALDTLAAGIPSYVENRLASPSNSAIASWQPPGQPEPGCTSDTTCDTWAWSA